MKTTVIIAFSALLAGCFHFTAPGVQADFYECPPGSTLHVCPVGQAPADPECRNVGSGTTTLPMNC